MYTLDNIPKKVKYFFLHGIYSDVLHDSNGHIVTANNCKEVESVIEKYKPQLLQVIKNK